MSREISGAALAETQIKLGTEPITIVEVTWGHMGLLQSYADRDFDGVPGRIVSMSGLDSIIQVGSSGASGGVSLELDDTDGSIKALLNTNDVHKSLVSVYQAFGDLTEGDKALLFKGQINTPIAWTEESRTIKFEVVSFIEDREIGFSPEQGEFDFIADNAIGVAWPLCFGSPIRVPAVKITEAVRGTSLSRYGLITLANLDTLCSRSEAFSVAEREKNVADQNPGYSDFNYAVVIDNYNAALESLTLFIEALISDSPTQEADIRAYSAVCINLEKENVNLLFWAGLAVTTQDAKAANELAIASLQAQIFEKEAEVPYPTAEIAALNAALVVQQDELADNNSDLLFYTVQVLATNININVIYGPEKDTLEANLIKIVITEIIVDGGEEFPQGVPVTIVVKAMKFRGIFTGRTFAITESNIPFYTGINITGSTNPNEFTLPTTALDMKGKYCFIPGQGIVFCDNQIEAKCVVSPILFEQTGALPEIPGFVPPQIREIWDPRTLGGVVSEVAVVIRSNWRASLGALPTFASGLSRITDQDWSLEIGDVIYLDQDFQDAYIANLIPSTSVLEVMAHRTIDGIRSLVPVPSRYYTINLAEAIAGQTSTVIRTFRPLDEYVGEGWEKNLFVSLISSVGPNTVDVIEYLVNTYTDFTKDATSFTAVHGELDPFPSHFAILDRPSALATIQNIAWQARCAAYLSNDKIKLTFLAKDNTPIATFNEDVVQLNSLVLQFTETEELVTKVVAQWRQSYVPEAEGEDPNEFVLRNNIPIYGENEQTYDFFIYNIKSFVEQSAFFWMVRYSSTWKKLTFTAFLDQLDLEGFDPVELDFPAGVIADTAVHGYILSTEYDSRNVSISFEVWVSVRSGEMETYVFAYPASADPGEVYPTVNDPFAGGAS